MPGRRFWLWAAVVPLALVMGGVSQQAFATTTALAAGPVVVRATLDADIGPATATYVAQAVHQAESRRAAALVLVLNTPGGLSSSMDDMVASLLNARVPVIAYVSPAGARADSAGLFVAQAADVVGMAPGTNIGSAHPIDSSGANIGGELEQKIVNDAVARVRDLASSHGRNADWCEKAVRQSVNVSASEAVTLHVADLQAADLPALLRSVDGRALVRPHGGATALHVAGVPVEDYPMSPTLQLLQLVDDPNIAYLLLLVAIFGLIAEVATPGAILPGTVGGIALILALVGFSSLPVNAAAVLLVLLAFALFIVDVKAHSHGVLTVGGLVSLVLGSALLVDTGPLGGGFGVSPWLIVGAAVGCAAFFGFVVGKAVAARRRPPYEMEVSS